MEKEDISDKGLLPDYRIGRNWMVENYENYYDKRIKATEIWARNVKDADTSVKLWQSIIRVLALIKNMLPVIKLPEYKTIMDTWVTYEKNYKIPPRETLLLFCNFLDDALYNLKVIYDEETEKEYIPPFLRGHEV